MFLRVLGALTIISLVSSQSASLFQLSFEDVLHKLPPSDIKGVAPSDTYPLVIRPLNFAPAVKAPPSILYPSQLFGTKSSVKGAVPLFRPLQPFPYIKYFPVSTSFYLNEPNVRNPLASVVGDDFPAKVSAPKPAYISVQDAQVNRRPSKDQLLSEINSETGSTEIPQTIENSTNASESNLPEDSQGPDWQSRLAGGNVKETELGEAGDSTFHNSKASLNLIALSRLDTSNTDDAGRITVIEA